MIILVAFHISPVTVKYNVDGFPIYDGYDVKLVRYAGVVGIYFHGLFMDSNPSQATVMAPSVMLCVFQMVYTIDTT